MTTASIHRLIEQHAAVRGDVLAIADQGRAISYRELNSAANAVARRLIAGGFRRGAHALVCMPRGIDLATVLLGVLKAGGSYTWRDPEQSDGSIPMGVSFRVGVSAREEQFLHLEVVSIVEKRIACSPNLPVLTRANDIACILEDGAGAPLVMVPHAAVTALLSRALPSTTPWLGEAGALDLWMALMAGTTAVVDYQPAAVAAAAAA